jgi:hypothetical protein
MDGTTLQNLFSQGNPFLAQMGEQAFNLDQDRIKATLQATQQKTSQDAQAFPLEQLVKQGQLDHYKALTRSGNAGAAAQEYTNSTQLPKEDVIAEGLRKIHSAQSDDQRKQFDAQMSQRMQLAAIARANKGVLPLEIMNQLPPEERNYFKDAQSTALMDAVANAYHKASPSWQEKRAEEEASLARTNAAGKWRVDAVEAKPVAAPRISGKPDIDPNNRQQLANYIASKKTTKEKYEAIAAFKGQYNEAEKEHWLDQYSLYKHMAETEAWNKKNGGTIDLSRVNGGKLPVNQARPMPGMEHNTPKPAGGPKKAYDKSGKAVYIVNPGDEAAAEALGYTVK